MAFATMPNSCELRDGLGRSWAVQVKAVGAAATEYRFVPGLTSVNPAVSTSGTDSTTIDSNGWTSETKTSRTLTVTLNGNYKIRDGVDVLHEAQHLLKVSGEEIGANGAIDLRVWNTEIDEGWESTFNNAWEGGAGDATGLRAFTSTLTSSCEPTRIHSVEEGAHHEESVPLDMDEYLKVLRPGSGSTEPTDPAGETDPVTEPTDPAA